MKTTAKLFLGISILLSASLATAEEAATAQEPAASEEQINVAKPKCPEAVSMVDRIQRLEFVTRDISKRTGGKKPVVTCDDFIPENFDEQPIEFVLQRILGSAELPNDFKTDFLLGVMGKKINPKSSIFNINCHDSNGTRFNYMFFDGKDSSHKCSVDGELMPLLYFKDYTQGV